MKGVGRTHSIIKLKEERFFTGKRLICRLDRFIQEIRYWKTG